MVVFVTLGFIQFAFSLKNEKYMKPRVTNTNM